MITFFFIFRRPIIAGWGRDMGTILWRIRNSIWICGWRLDRLVDPIKIGFTGSPTLRPRTCGRPVVFQPLEAPNQYRAPNLRSSWPCSNTRLSSPSVWQNEDTSMRDEVFQVSELVEPYRVAPSIELEENSNFRVFDCRTRHRGGLKNCSWKRTDFWHPVL